MNEAKSDEITITWCVEDIETIRPDLSKDQAREVLQNAKRCHDANVGINWIVLETIADELFPRE